MDQQTRIKDVGHPSICNTDYFDTLDYYEDSSHNAIGWCARTHNWFRGCSPVSEACKYCYAMAEAAHQVQMKPDSPYARIVVVEPGKHPQWTGIVERTGLGAWLAPFRTRKRWLAFANSMSDAFHENIPDADVLLLFRFLWRANWHTWQVLTKRHERLSNFMSRLHLVDGELQLAGRPLPSGERFSPPNVWLGVTVENQRWADKRIPHLLEANAMVRFVSLEPLLGPVDLTPYVGLLHWVIVGGESAGPEGKYRSMDLAWVRPVRDICVASRVPFFFKQVAGLDPNRLSKDLDGVMWRQLPRRLLGPLPTDAKRKALRLWAQVAYGSQP